MGESREHVSARVLSTTNDELRSQKDDNPIKEVADRGQEGDQEKPEVIDNEGEGKEEAVDADSQEIQQKFDDVSGDTVLNFSFLFCSLFVAQLDEDDELR